MPEVHVRLRWPDGSVQQVYSPSLVVTDHLEAGRTYPIDELMPLVRTALHEASERVRASYGFPCSLAAASLAEVEAKASAFAGGDATVEGFDR